MASDFDSSLREWGSLHAVVEPMKHVGECFRVHEPVLDGHLEDKAIFNEWLPGLIEISGIQQFIYGKTGTLVVGNNRIDVRPIPGLIVRQLAVNRVDTEFEQPIKLGIRRRDSEGIH